jgi:hypothetical protein
MKVFVIFGDIEFLDDYENTALIRKTHSSGLLDEETIEALAMRDDCDYITPHYYNGHITFMQYHKESAE